MNSYTKIKFFHFFYPRFIRNICAKFKSMNNIKIDLQGLDDINDKLDFILQRIDKKSLPPEQIIYDNKGLQEFLNVSAGKASLLRKNGKLAYSKDSHTGKIWYKLSDILEYIDSCYYERFK